MATRSEIESYQSVIDGLTTVAYAQIKALLRALDDPNPIAFRNALLATYPDLLAPFLTASSDVAAAWYRELRAEAGVTSRAPATETTEPPKDQLDAVVRNSLSPLFRPEPFIGADILTLLAGSSQRLIANQGRETIDGLARRDVVTVSWARVARPGCCAFCAMLAGRGSVYRSESAAGAVIGRGVDASEAFNADGSRKVGGIGGGIKARGSQQIASQYHDHCRCVVAPTFYSVSDTTADFGRGQERFLVPLGQ